MSDWCQGCGKAVPNRFPLAVTECDDCYLKRNKRGSEAWDEVVARSERLNALETTLVRWWKTFRPIHWNEKEHLDSPTVNMRGKETHELAEALAKYLKEKSK